MDKKCSRILDKAIHELFYQDRRLNKKYYGLSFYEKKMAKIKREEEFKKIGNKTSLLEKKLDKDQILSNILPKDEEIIKLFYDKKEDINYDIEQLYEKSKILKYFNKNKKNI